MNRYMVSINGRAAREIQAGRTAVAVKKALDPILESALKPVSTIHVQYIGKVEYTYDIIADVPFDYGENGKGHKRETVLRGFETEAQAQVEVGRLKAAHTDWNFIRPVKRQMEAK